ncbi:general secretion pathway protein I [Yersinia aldovae]|uniref:type II secretion system minor pseudopilin GspI n=1 Tax=Yersinia aldovae TaxID=29483 RepID=UPI0005E3754D|nr:type II secretion system minor pseudopilin GspI [Yersinia aldovae]CNI12237.1 general secretion pathway protein I [Yersinia aldovae]
MRKYTGFTLLEMMVALAIFAVSGISIMYVVNDQLIMVRNLDKNIICYWVADNILTEIKINGVKQSGEWLKGRESMANRQWYWQSKEVISHNEQIGSIIIEVREYGGGVPPCFSLMGYRIIDG